MLGLVCC